MFNRCDFVVGGGHAVLIVVPKPLPPAETYTVSVSEKDIKFSADYERFAKINYPGGDLFNHIAQNVQVGIVEYSGEGKFPDHISNLAYVEVRKAV